MLHPLNIYSTQCTICSTLEYNTYMPGTWCYFYLYPSQHYKLLWLAQFFKRKRKKVLHTYLLIYVIKRWNCRLCCVTWCEVLHTQKQSYDEIMHLKMIISLESMKFFLKVISTEKALKWPKSSKPNHLAIQKYREYKACQRFLLNI